MTTPATVVSTTSSGYLDTSSPVSLSSISAQYGDLLLIWAAAGDATDVFGTVTATGAATLAVTTRQIQTAGSTAPVGLWTAPVTATGLYTVSVPLTATGAPYGITVQVLRNHGGVGASSKGNGSGSAPSLAVTTGAAGSSVFAFFSDWDAVDGSSRTWRTINSITPSSGSGEALYFYDAWYYTNYLASWSDAGAAGSKTTGLSAPGGQKWSGVAVEILGEPGSTYDFTGSNGYPWPSPWTSSFAATGSAATIQSNQGRLHAGTNTGYTGKKSMYWSTSTLDNVEVSGKFTYNSPSVDATLEVWLRGGSTTDNGANGYFAQFRRDGTARIFKAVSSAYTQVGSSYSISFSDGVAYRFRFQTRGNTQRLKVWAAVGTEPTGWSVTGSDSSLTSAGWIHLHLGGGNAANGIVDLDDINITTSFTVDSTATASFGFTARGAASASQTVSATGSAGFGFTARGSAYRVAPASGAASFGFTARGSATTGAVVSTTATTGFGFTARASGWAKPTWQYYFKPPYVERKMETRDSMWRKKSYKVGLTVLKEDDAYRLVEDPTHEEATAADVLYIGGHVYRITKDEYDSLFAAGYTPQRWVLDIATGTYGPAVPDDPDGVDPAGYGEGGYGEGGYGT